LGSIRVGTVQAGIASQTVFLASSAASIEGGGRSASPSPEMKPSHAPAIIKSA
jgi:hypothetical protein